MTGLSPNCIFCDREFSPSEEADASDTSERSQIVRRTREHIVPKVMHGPWVIRDVCDQCNSTLGSDVDCRASEDPRIRKAILSLELPDLHALMLYRSKSTDNKRSVKATDLDSGQDLRLNISRKGPKLAPVREVCSFDAEDLRQELERLARERTNLDPEQISQLLERTELKVNDSPYGEFVEVPELGMSFEKRKAGITFESPSNHAWRLVAKIAFEFAFYCLPEAGRAYWQTLDLLRRHALWGHPIPPGTISPPPWWGDTAFEHPKPDYVHTVKFAFESEYTHCDVELFGFARYEVMFVPDVGKTAPSMSDEGEVVRELQFQVVFDPPARIAKKSLWILRGDREREELPSLI